MLCFFFDVFLALFIVFLRRYFISPVTVYLYLLLVCWVLYLLSWTICPSHWYAMLPQCPLSSVHLEMFSSHFQLAGNWCQWTWDDVRTLTDTSAPNILPLNTQKQPNSKAETRILNYKTSKTYSPILSIQTRSFELLIFNAHTFKSYMVIHIDLCILNV